MTEPNVLDIVLMFGAKMDDLLSVFAVAPLVGARVEIASNTVVLPARNVAPLVGARVEIGFLVKYEIAITGRSPRGSAG